MSISTKSGDKGTTGLWSGQRVKKFDLRVDAYGTVDELNSFLGEARHLVKSEESISVILEIQNDLFRVGGSLATIGEFRHPVLDEDVERLTAYVHKFEEAVPFKGFVVPGNTVQSAKLDVCRTVARRAERRTLELDDAEPVGDAVKKYLNRLSDLIYMLARWEEHLEGKLMLKVW